MERIFPTRPRKEMMGMMIPSTMNSASELTASLALADIFSKELFASIGKFINTD